MIRAIRLKHSSKTRRQKREGHQNAQINTSRDHDECFYLPLTIETGTVQMNGLQSRGRLLSMEKGSRWFPFRKELLDIFTHVYHGWTDSAHAQKVGSERS